MKTQRLKGTGSGAAPFGTKCRIGLTSAVPERKAYFGNALGAGWTADVREVGDANVSTMRTEKYSNGVRMRGSSRARQYAANARQEKDVVISRRQ